MVRATAAPLFIRRVMIIISSNDISATMLLEISHNSSEYLTMVIQAVLVTDHDFCLVFSIHKSWLKSLPGGDFGSKSFFSDVTETQKFQSREEVDRVPTMISSVVVQPFRIELLKDLIPMVMSLYEEDSYGEPMSEDKVRLSVTELQNHPEKGQIYLFLHQNKAVGYAICINFWSNEHGGDIIFIDEIYVRPQWRFQGISTQFIQFLSRRDGNVKGFQVEVTPTNKDSYRFFLKQGFVPDRNRFLFKKGNS